MFFWYTLYTTIRARKLLFLYIFKFTCGPELWPTLILYTTVKPLTQTDGGYEFED